MKQMVWLLVLGLILFVGCDDDDAPNPAAPEAAQYQIMLDGLPESLIGYGGQILVSEFEARVLENGRPVAGVEVSFYASSGAEVVRPKVQTDARGLVANQLNITLTARRSVDLTLTAGNSIQSARIALTTIPRPVRIALNIETPTFRLPLGVNGGTVITATPFDSSGRPITGFPLQAWLEGVGPAAPFGSVTQNAKTDETGGARLTFSTLSGAGSVNVVAVPSLTDSLTTAVRGEGRIVVQRLQDIIHRFSLDAIPEVLVVPEGEIGAAALTARVLDNGLAGLPGVEVSFVTDLGSVPAAVATDKNGVAAAELRVLNQYGAATVTAAITGANFQATKVVRVVNPSPRPFNLTLQTDRNWIYSDNGVTTAQLTAFVTDSTGQTLKGKRVLFSASHGAVQSSVLTDSLGRAQAVFTDIGLPSVDPDGNPDSAVVTARVPELGLEASVRMMIRALDRVSQIFLQSAVEQMTVGRNDSAQVRATCILENDNPAPNGVTVHFDTRYGLIRPSTGLTENNTGRTGANYYLPPNLVATDTLRAWVDNGDAIITSNLVIMQIIAGPPARISLRWEEPFVIAAVTDALGNPVRAGTVVSFSTTLGSIAPTVATTANGEARARLTRGAESGVAEVTATVQGLEGPIQSPPLLITFQSGAPNAIELTADRYDLYAPPSLEYATLRAVVKDANGSLVDVPTVVVFQTFGAPNPPVGCSINQRGAIDSTLTANGVAIARLYPGTRIGVVLLRAYTWSDSARNDTVSVIFSSIAVYGGEPASIDIDVNNNGRDAGGGAWAIPVAARVWDIHRNPVRADIPVVFTVDPEVAQIAPARTSRGGIAETELIYNSVNTFDQVTITATIVTHGREIVGEREVQLPLQRGVLTLTVDPANWMFPEDAQIRVSVSLVDGHDVLINGAPVLFTTSRGFLYWFNQRRNRMEIFHPNPAILYTGRQDENHYFGRGSATAFLIVAEEYIFLDPFTLETLVQVDARVVGYNEVQARPAFIFFTRRG